MLNKLSTNLSSQSRTTLVYLFDSFSSVFSFAAAIVMRYGSIDNPVFVHTNIWEKLAIVLVIHQLIYWMFGLYKGIWRFASTHDLQLILKAVSVATIATFSILFLTNNLMYIPRSIIFIYWMLNIIVISGGRFFYRLQKDRFVAMNGERSLVIGAGSAGERLVRDVRRNPNFNQKINIVGFIDDDPRKYKKTIHGISILGNQTDIIDICQKQKISKIIIAIPSASSKQIREILSHCPEDGSIQVKVLPSVAEMTSNEVQLSSLRDISTNDLLGRTPVTLDQELLKDNITNKVVMITGAGGSIGSELSNQIARLSPTVLILFELSEFNLYEIEKKMARTYPDIKIIPIIGNICEREKVEKTLRVYRPDIIFHAAAYKHVPLMESFAVDCLRNNVGGTKTLADSAVMVGIPKFVMVSTDKAVNPTNVMGASKRIAEMVCLNYADHQKKTNFVIVRFGNVLGSRGSVIPLFKEQISLGGPVTITHSEITRFFMSIPEAAQLVMQAGSQGNGGEVLVLDMGQPIKIYDLAKELIKLAGLRPEVDIPIKVVGLRPGEKLFEELFNTDEQILPTRHPRVKSAQANRPPENFDKLVKDLLSLPLDFSPNEVRQLIKSIIKNYNPKGEEGDNSESTKSIH